MIALVRRALAPIALASLLLLGTSLLLVHHHGHTSIAPDCAACVIAQAPAEPESAVAPTLSAPLERTIASPQTTGPILISPFSYAAPLACGPPAA